jgi:DNA-binding CsgD family transcriptional regulator
MIEYRSASVRDEIAIRLLDVLDIGVIALSADRRETVFANQMCKSLGPAPVEPLRETIEAYVAARAQSSRIPPAIRVEVGKTAFYVRVLPSPGSPPLEIVLVREEVVRDVDVFRMLNMRFEMSRREYQILCGVRLGKTNRQIATEYGLAEGTIARHVHRLLERLQLDNRTALAGFLEHLISNRR